MSCKISGDGNLVLVRESGTSDPYAPIGCVFNFTPPGITYATVTAEQCLDEVGAPATELGDAEASTFGIQTNYCPGGAASEQRREWAKNRTKLDFRIEYKESTNCTLGAYEDFAGRIQVFQPTTAERDTFIKTDLTVLVDGNTTVTCLGQQVVDIAALVAISIAGLVQNQGVRLDDGSVYRWDESATSGDEEPSDKPNPGVDPGYWILV